MGVALDRKSGSNNAGNAASNEAKWKAAGFLNVYVKHAGGRKKLAGIPLRINNTNERAIFEFLNQEDEAKRVLALAKVLAKLDIDFQLVEETDLGLSLED